MTPKPDAGDLQLARLAMADLVAQLDDWLELVGTDPLIADTEPFDEARALRRTAATFLASRL